MTFKDWLQLEVGLNLSKPPVATMAAPNPKQTATANAVLARKTMAQYGPKLATGLAKASTPAKAGELAIGFAKKAADSVPQQPSRPSSTFAAAGDVYSQATGTDLKMMGKR